MKNFYDQGNNDIWVVIATKWCHYLFYWQSYFLALGTFLPKSFTRAFSSNSCLNVCEVSLQASSSLGDIVKSRRARGTRAGTQKKGPGRERRACNDHSFIFLSYLCGTLCQPKLTTSWTKSVKNFGLSYPQNAHPDYLIPLWPLPWHHPGQCCPFKVRNGPARLQHCFRGKGRGVGGFVVASAFQSFILKLDMAFQSFILKPDMAMSIFLRITLLSKIVAWSSDFLPTVAWLGLYMHQFWSR